MIGTIPEPSSLTFASNSKLLSLELSRSYKENHGTKFLKICKPICDTFANLVAALSAKHVKMHRISLII